MSAAAIKPGDRVRHLYHELGAGTVIERCDLAIVGSDWIVEWDDPLRLLVPGYGRRASSRGSSLWPMEADP